MTDPDVFVIFKEGDSHGTADGTLLTSDVDERMARHRKVGRCVRYVPNPHELTHRPSSIDPGHTACGLVLERFPINLNLQLGEGETCARCTHVVAQVAKAREQVRPIRKETTE